MSFAAGMAKFAAEDTDGRAIVKDPDGVRHRTIRVPISNMGDVVVLAHCELAVFLVGKPGEAREWRDDDLEEGEPDCMACVAGTGAS